MAMSKYETIIWEKEMKEQISCKHPPSGYFRCYMLTSLLAIALARATYKDSFSNGSVFDVIHSTRKLNLGGFMLSTPGGVDTHLIVYKSPPSVRGDMEILITIENASTAQGLEALRQQMQDQLGSSLGKSRSCHKHTSKVTC